MKFKGLLLLLAVGIFPSSLFSNTLYFPQVAFGGGYSTTFVIVNTGTTSVSSTLNFYSQGGAARTDLSTPITVAAGSSARFTIPNAGPLTVVWGEFAAGSGTVQGVATFDLRDSNGVLVTSAGVLGLEGKTTFLLPVDVTPSGATGVAVANTSGNPMGVGLRLIGEDGNQVAVSTDARFTQMAVRAQVADFVTSLFPQLAGTTFKGTLVIEAASGAPANALAATALTVKEGLLSALPVIAGGTPGASILDFPQIAFGGGYSTTFTLMNASATPVVAFLNVYAQSGAARGDLSTIINIPATGSTRYTIPNTGPLTVVWGELVASSGTVQGVATFDLRAPNGVLTTSAGVLGIQPGSGFTLPVDVTPSSSTGIALANPSNGSLSLGLRLFNESGSLVATATDPRFTSLASRGQVADFVNNIFPQLSGTTFKGTLSVDLGTGAPAGSSIAATALTVKEGLLAALPVIPGSVGSGGGGSTTAIDCLNPALYTTASTLHLEYATSGAQTGTSVSDAISTLNATFEGQSATEIKLTTVNTYTGASPTTTNVRNYSKLDGTDILTYGNIADGAQGTAKQVFSPIARDKKFSLNVGETTSQTYNVTTTVTPNGLPPIVQQSTQTTTVRFVSREAVTVPAGTFNTCKFDTNNGASTDWFAVGWGVRVKIVTNSQGSLTTQQLKTGTINGSPIQ